MFHAFHFSSYHSNLSCLNTQQHFLSSIEYKPGNLFQQQNMAIEILLHNENLLQIVKNGCMLKACANDQQVVQGYQFEEEDLRCFRHLYLATLKLLFLFQMEQRHHD